MAATVHVLRPQSPSIAGYLRVGHTGHRKLLDLHAGERLSFRRIVFDVTHFNEQLELAKTLKVGGCEIVLDPNFAEMAMVGRLRVVVDPKIALEQFARSLAARRFRS